LSLHEKGYRYNESGRIGDLTPRQVKKLQLGDAVQSEIKQRQYEQQQGGKSLSHDYDVSKSRAEAFQ
jgi:hypothetical protein